MATKKGLTPTLEELEALIEQRTIVRMTWIANHIEAFVDKYVIEMIAKSAGRRLGIKHDSWSDRYEISDGGALDIALQSYTDTHIDEKFKPAMEQAFAAVAMPSDKKLQSLLKADFKQKLEEALWRSSDSFADQAIEQRVALLVEEIGDEYEKRYRGNRYNKLTEAELDREGLKELSELREQREEEGEE